MAAHRQIMVKCGEDAMYIEQFIEMLVAERGASQNTLVAYKNDVVCLFGYLNALNIPLEQTSKEHILQYFSSLQVRNFSSRTLARKLSVTRQLFDFLVDERRCSYNPLISLKNPKINSSVPKALSKDNILLLISSSYDDHSSEGIRTSAMLEMLYATGLRISELVTLKVQSLEYDPKDGHLTQHLFIKGKGGKERIVLLNPEAIEILTKYLAIRSTLIKDKQKNEWLFPSIDKRGRASHITRQRFGQILKQLAISAGISLKLVSPHKIRHSFATHMLENGANLRILQELLGHSDISSTQIYTKIEQKKATQSVFEKHPLAKA